MERHELKLIGNARFSTTNDVVPLVKLNRQQNTVESGLKPNKLRILATNAS